MVLARMVWPLAWGLGLPREPYSSTEPTLELALATDLGFGLIATCLAIFGINILNILIVDFKTPILNLNLS